MDVVPLHGDFREELEGHTSGRAEGLDLLVGSGLLLLEVVRGKREDLKTLGLVLLVE